ncbi:hypothetical protein L195_g047820, partial [Trifolium pratense]
KMVRPPPQNASTSNLSTSAGASSNNAGLEGQPQAFSSDAAFDSTIGTTNPTFHANTFGGHNYASIGSTQVTHVSNPTNLNSQGNPNDGRSPPRSPFSFPTNLGFGMPTTLMENLFSNQHMESPPRFSPSTSDVGNSGTVLNPLINNTNDSYQLLAGQMSRIADFFGAPPVRNQPFRPIQNQIPVQHQSMPEYNGYNVSHTNPPVRVREEPHVQMGMPHVPNPGVTLVHRNQDADEVVRNVQQDNCDGQNNLANMVETILAQNGLNVGLYRPNFVSAFS